MHVGGTMHEVDNAAVPFKYTFIHSIIHLYVLLFSCTILKLQFLISTELQIQKHALVQCKHSI